MELPWSFNYSQLESVATPQQIQASAKAIIQQKLRFNISTPGVAAQTLGLKRPTTSLGSNGITNNGAHVTDALQAAEESMVLLKNDSSTLPINKSAVHTVAVLGASVPWTLTGTMQTGTVNFAADVRLGDLGSSRVASDPSLSVGPLAGITAAAGSGITVVTRIERVGRELGGFHRRRRGAHAARRRGGLYGRRRPRRLERKPEPRPRRERRAAQTRTTSSQLRLPSTSR